MERSSKRLRVLVIDDEELLRKALRLTLGRWFDVVLAASAEEALKLIAGGGWYDAILCDLSLGGISGRAFYDRLLGRSFDQASRVIVMSGSLGPNSEIDSGDPFAVALSGRWLAKPSTTSEIRSVVERVAGSAGRPLARVAVAESTRLSA